MPVSQLMQDYLDSISIQDDEGNEVKFTPDEDTEDEGEEQE